MPFPWSQLCHEENKTTQGQESKNTEGQEQWHGRQLLYHCLTIDNAPSPFSVHDGNKELKWDSVIIKNYCGGRLYVYKYLKTIQVDDKKVRFCFILYD